MTDCEVCCGRRVITLPLYKLEVSALAVDVPAVLERSSREYLCPECSAGDAVPFERIGSIKEATEGPGALSGDERLLNTMKRSIAMKMAAALVDRGYIRFEVSLPDARGIFRMRASLCAVAPTIVAKFEERVAERQFEVAEEVVAAAEEQIANWGSFYHGRTGGSVHKHQAVEWLREAIRKVKERYG